MIESGHAVTGFAPKPAFYTLFAMGLIGGVVSMSPAVAQSGDFGQFRAAAIEALGGEIETIEFTGRGWDACLGQAWAVTAGWARWEITDYRRTIDFSAGTSTQSAMRRAGLDPERVGGCGAQVGAQASRQQSSIRSAASFADRLPIWLTPHGFLALAADGVPDVRPDGNGWSVTLPVVSGGVTYSVVAAYGADYLPNSIRTWIDNPIFGDMEVNAVFGAFRDFGGVNFPERLTLTQGGFATLELTIDSASAGVAPPEIGAAPPRRPGAAAGESSFSEIGDGIFVLHGGYQAVVVEFESFAVVIDGMQSDSRTQELIEFAHAMIPGKPIRYVVVTHSHFDHISGLRQFAAEGAVILTHEINVPFFREALSAARTLNPDLAEPSQVSVEVQGVTDRFVISDATGQSIELITLAPSPHAADMLIALLPTLGIVVEADLLQPWINPIFAGSGDGPHAYLVYLSDELDRADLDYSNFLPIHTPPEPPLMPRSALEEAVRQ